MRIKNIIAASAGFFLLISFCSGMQLSAYAGESQISYDKSDYSALISIGYESTPFGWVYKDCIHEVNDDEILVPRQGGASTVSIAADTKAGRLLEKYVSESLEAVPQTAGSTEDILSAIPEVAIDSAPLISDCRYPVIADSEGLAQVKQSGKAPTLNSWVEAASTSSLGNLSYIHVEWNVPKAPKKNGGLIYLFPAFVDPGIMQPVLQWGVGYAGGGNYWTMASWILLNNNVYHSKLQKVTGSTVSGDISGNGCKTSSGVCSTWTVTTYDWGSKRSTTLTRTSWKKPMSTVYGGALEAYFVTSCSQLPASATKFKNFYIEDVANKKKNPSWKATYWSASPKCNYGVTIGSDDSITLKYQ
ncbi:MAG: hypothetical protein LBI99_01810 [Propionibacteriaceae bacterium]|jgi:hypothetical protein|nr:hypothetical protein [Propionibacteriaceae bacterium]